MMRLMPDYKVQLDTYTGPMDLLLYLIRREEVDIYDIPIAQILEQYLVYVRLLEKLDPDAIGDFLVLAAALMEIKSRMLLPKPPPEVDDDDSLDPRADLVRQLLAYRSFREAAVHLNEQAELRSRRFGRPHTGVPESDEQVDIEDVQIWDLMTAFKTLLDAVGQQPVTHDVIYDDTPISLHAADILDRLVRDGPSMMFEEVFEGRWRAEMIGLFLALLELMRQKRVRVQQEGRFGTIRVHLLDATPISEADIADAVGEMDEVDRDEVDRDEDTASDEEDAQEEADTAAGPVFDEDEEAEEDDEFARRINAVEVVEVDLGRSSSESSGNGNGSLDEPESDKQETERKDS